MKPLRKNVALAIDGGGIKGVIVTRALSILEKAIAAPLDSFVNLCAGTSTGAIISAGVACGLTADHLFKLYVDLGKTIFKPSWHTALFPLSRYRYPIEPLAEAAAFAVGSRVEHPHRERTAVHSNPRRAGVVAATHRAGAWSALQDGGPIPRSAECVARVARG